MPSATKQAIRISIKLATTVGHFLLDLDCNRLYNIFLVQLSGVFLGGGGGGGSFCYIYSNTMCTKTNRNADNKFVELSGPQYCFLPQPSFQGNDHNLVPLSLSDLLTEVCNVGLYNS